jgi:hypothetical protein
MNSNQEISNFIFCYPKLLDSTTCDNIINYYNKDHFKGWKTSTFTTTNSNTGTSKVEMKDYWIEPKDKFYETLQKGFEKTVNDYVSVHDKIKVQEYTHFRINCYEAGGFMKEHIDNIHHSHGQKQGYPHITSLIFLNEDYDGGEFTLCGETIDKGKGSAVVFPSNFMYPHEVKKVTSGVRYSIMTWVM